uniref:Protein deacetylase HDAC6 n=1 Tax=Poecilia formosa TaxID=48698 RepID=A0A096LUY7_POEFO
SFQVCVTAVGSVLQLVDRVLTSELRNGFAVIRPPGHHAQADQPNGFCVFNNMAVAARYAQKRHAVNRVLIVDWDVHHGQGIQYLFQEDSRQESQLKQWRTESGAFWPHLQESDCSFVGSGRAEGRTINLPWNKTGMSDADYITAFQQVLLPVVSAGFDAAAGDPKGEMCVHPQCFHILTHMLMSLAEGRLVLALEGGYDLQATAEGVAACVTALLGGACPPLNLPTAPSDSALLSISETISALYPHWASLQVLAGPGPEGRVITAAANHSSPTPASINTSVATTTGLVYDEKMMEHVNLWDRHHPEQPQRISKIFSKLEQQGLVARCHRIPARLATEEELAMCHSLQHIERMKATAEMKPRDLHKLGNEFTSIFFSNQSFQCSQLAAGSCFNVVDAILSGQLSNGVAIVRPPGHHAERDAPCGFCLFNTAALTARYAQKNSHDPQLRVLILDWDIHHGNGTQHMFEDDNSVLYISLHRYDNGTFFPFSEDAAADRVGVAKGAGFNVNIAWNGGRMGDSDYLAAFHHVVMPIAAEFNPGLVLVSAGFDAARGDPLGGYQVTPEGYAHLTHLLMSLAGGRVLIILEGGYNLTSISDSMAMCTSVLLGDAPPSLATPFPPPHHCAVATIRKVIRQHAPYWRSLRITIPELVQLALPSPKHRGKCSSQGRKSDKRPLPPAGQEVATVMLQIEKRFPSKLHRVTQMEGVEQLTQGLASLDITQAPPTPQEPPTMEVKGDVESKLENSQSAESLQTQVSSLDPPLSDLYLPSVTMAAAESDPKGGAGSGEGAEPTSEGACALRWAESVDISSPANRNLNECPGVTSNLSLPSQDTLYVVDPLPWCPHLDAVKPLPPSGVDVFQVCSDCGSDSENWICLTCYEVCCGRYVNEHMVTHGAVSEHPVVLSFSDLSVWCYLCESYVHHQVLFEAKNAAHFAKFGEDVPPWS